MWDVVLRVRKTAFRLMPVLVVVWATVAVLGGAIYLANHAGPSDGDDAAKAGLGLCAVSVAIFAGRAVRRLTPFVAGLRPALSLPRLLDRPVHETLSGPPATGPPIFLLLRVSRT